MSTYHFDDLTPAMRMSGAPPCSYGESTASRGHSAGSGNGTIRVMLAEPPGIRSLLKKIREVELVADVNYERDLVRMISERHPHVILFTKDGTGLDGLSVIGRILKKFPTVRAIIMGHAFTPEYVSHALRAGVSGLLPDKSSVTELKHALKEVRAGKTHVVARYSPRGKDKPATPARANVTPRQREVLELIAVGKNTKEIAGLLQISVKTVEAHRWHLMKRLRIHNLTGLVRYALRTGLARLEG